MVAMAAFARHLESANAQTATTELIALVQFVRPACTVTASLPRIVLAKPFGRVSIVTGQFVCLETISWNALMEHVWALRAANARNSGLDLLATSLCVRGSVPIMGNAPNPASARVKLVGMVMAVSSLFVPTIAPNMVFA